MRANAVALENATQKLRTEVKSDGVLPHTSVDVLIGIDPAGLIPDEQTRTRYDNRVRPSRDGNVEAAGKLQMKFDKTFTRDRLKTRRIINTVSSDREELAG